MIFAEQKKGDGYYYFLEDVMGEVELFSPRKLEAKELDGIILTIIQIKGTEGKVADVDYKYKPNKIWE